MGPFLHNSSIHGRFQGMVKLKLGCHATDTPGLVLPSSNEHDVEPLF
jgi:hypothetical protein